MATSDQIDAAAKGPSKPTGAHLLGDSHALAGVGLTYGVDGTDAAAAEMFVRRAFNRHDCEAAKRAAEDESMGWARMRYECTDPRHGEDVAAMAEALQWLGLRPTPPPTRRRDAVTARPKYREKRGTCPRCGRRRGLRVDGTVGAHGGCDGYGQKPKEDG